MRLRKVAVEKLANITASCIEALAHSFDGVEPCPGAFLSDPVSRGSIGASKYLKRQILGHLRILGIKQEHERTLTDSGTFATPRCVDEIDKPRHIGTLDAIDVELRVVEDRKSTRLNSSHQLISYVVFCLQKN